MVRTLLLPPTPTAAAISDRCCGLRVRSAKLGCDRKPPSSLELLKLDDRESLVNTNLPSAEREMRPSLRCSCAPPMPSTQSSRGSWSRNELERDRVTMLRTTLHPLLRLDIRVDLDLEKYTYRQHRRKTPSVVQSLRCLYAEMQITLLLLLLFAEYEANTYTQRCVTKKENNHSVLVER